MVAYLQPISRSRVGAIRGVNVDGVMRTLVTRGLVEEGERDAETGAMLFRTTTHFLERMGLNDLHDLPPLAPHLPEASLLEAELAGFAAQPDASAILDADREGHAARPHRRGGAGVSHDDDGTEGVRLQKRCSRRRASRPGATRRS